MSSVFDNQFNQYAAPQLKEQFGVLVKLASRGSSDTSSFLCPFSLVEDEVDLEQDALGTAAERRTWWPQVADLSVKPRSGDLLLVVDSDGNETGERHEVMPHGDRPGVEIHPGGEQYVIRTKKVLDAS